ncbi:serine/Threonine protein kinase [Salpingoeca rosetta]|uniref:Serine/Threonine protein kinase n=1 Tax=Salpingoeca rosetta (strain ATCC 50818 / BSB-021) TaxID=946362 RepID=F2UCK8_SALR5|nr:serine/Threonine protein kinase [Salpingoeca rosetta]EGD74315.1 serine/Threonine protein kinase [Salpingoeca rosetta]|eukprot:XP_004993215.1 serine/Threonine protein kinase [Salpingoeca rosetta]
MATQPELKTSFTKETTWEAICTGGNPAISHDGKYYIVPCHSNVNAIDLDTGRVFHSFEPDTDPALAAAISNDNELVATSSRSLVVKIWSFRTFECLKSFKAHEAPTVAMDFDNITNSLLATGAANGAIKVWDVRQGYCTHVFRGSVGVVSFVRFHPSEFQLFTSSDDCRLRYWNLKDKSKHQVLDAHSSVVRDIAFDEEHPNRFYTAARDQLVHRWSAAKMKIKSTIPLHEAIEGLVLGSIRASFFRDCEGEGDALIPAFVTAGDHGVRFWRPDGTELFPRRRKLWMTKPCKRMVYSSEARRVVVLTHELHVGIVQLDNIADTREMIGHYDEITDLRFFSPSVDRDLLIVSTNSHDVHVVDPGTRSSTTLAAHTDIVLAVDVSADGTAVATVSKDSLCIVWSFDGASFRPVFTCTGHTATVVFCKKSKNALFTGSEDTTVKKWTLPWDDVVKNDEDDDSVDRTIKGAIPATVEYSRIAHKKDINSLDVAPNDKLLASASQDRTIKLWNTHTGDAKLHLKGHKRGVWCVRFSPSDQIVASASGDATVKLWNAVSGACLRTMEGHTNSILKLVFVSKGTQIVSSSSDGVVKLWTLRTGDCVTTLDGHDEKIWALDVSGSGEKMATGAADGTIAIWRDDSKEKDDAARKQEEERLREDQELNNLIQSQEYAEAFRRAVNKNRPRTLLRLLRHLRDADEMDEVEPCIQQLDIEQITRLLSFIENWNFNSKTSREAHELLNIIITTTSHDHLLKIPNCAKTLDSLIAYSERHMRRIQQLTQKTAFLDYTHEGMRAGVSKKRRHEES